MWRSLSLALYFTVSATVADGGSGPEAASHAVLRLGNQRGQAVLLGCLSDNELNAKAAADQNGRPFGWQFASPDFSCSAPRGRRQALTAQCVYTNDAARFLDLFFVSAEACDSFARTVAPSCADATAADCLAALEQLLKTAPVTGPAPI